MGGTRVSARKRYGFWKEPATVALLRAVLDGRVTKEDAATRLDCPPDDIDWYTRALKRSERSHAITIIQQVTAAGDKISVPLPSDLARAYGLVKDAFVAVEPTNHGLLLKPVKVVPALSEEESAHVKEIVRRYRPALDAMAKGESRVGRD